MKRELEESARERERLQRRIERLGKQYPRLKRELDAARRAGYRQAVPFAKTVRLEPKRPGRRGGAEYGQPARRCRPNRVEVRHDVTAAAELSGLRRTNALDRYGHPVVNGRGKVIIMTSWS